MKTHQLMIKKISIFSLFFLLSIFGNAQSITPKTISKIVGDFYNQTHNDFLEKNEFQNWTAFENGQNWYNRETKESVALTYDEVYYNEGGKHVVAIYDLGERMLQNFVKQLPNAKFMYSKKNKQYIRRFNTYTYETIKIEPIGENAHIIYTNHLGKEDGSYPNFKVLETPKRDTIVKKEKAGNDTIVRKYIGTRQIEKSRFSGGKLIAKKNFVTGDFKRFNSNSQMIYHSYHQNNGKEYIVEEWDSEGKLKKKSVYDDDKKELIEYRNQVLFKKSKILESGKHWVTEYDESEH
ncbi:hypothetical protein [Chryseobacterium sp. EO14]|uniref:hypothetical protein n=1 Tax=Chryseobacterium sp. EO14 TaxID=2950551 RepID=UPI00210D9ACF|nr:hypothetical protein [Chryseobacterium sp. EO14]MCQ4142653.1 hypothetical protein [Chryseobacterium sp. EO14]